MTIAQARKKALKLWGEKGRVAKMLKVSRPYLVGEFEFCGLMIKGRGDSWEEAFEDAEKAEESA